jgi:hypothetical protein
VGKVHARRVCVARLKKHEGHGDERRDAKNPVSMEVLKARVDLRLAAESG